MFSNNYFLILLCSCVLHTKSEDATQYFNGITIKVYRNEIPVTLLRADSVSNEHEATDIVIEDENVTTLKSGTFSNLRNLKYISLKRNNINKMEAYAFKDLPKVRIINLNFNFIKRITENIFADLPVIKLYLKGNGIEILDAFAFKNLSYLETLDLSSNNIGTLPEDLFHKTKNLRHINLSFNNLQEGPKRRKIYRTGYFEEAFRNNVVDEHEYSVLDLSNNNFTCVDDLLFQGVLTVKYILLTNNNIRKINDHGFKDLIYIQSLDLSGNYLEELPNEIMKKLEHIDEIILNNNPWNLKFARKYTEWCTVLNKTNTMDTFTETAYNL